MVPGRKKRYTGETSLQIFIHNYRWGLEYFNFWRTDFVSDKVWKPQAQLGLLYLWTQVFPVLHSVSTKSNVFSQKKGLWYNHVCVHVCLRIVNMCVPLNTFWTNGSIFSKLCINMPLGTVIYTSIIDNSNTAAVRELLRLGQATQVPLNSVPDLCMLIDFRRPCNFCWCHFFTV